MKDFKCIKLAALVSACWFHCFISGNCFAASSMHNPQTIKLPSVDLKGSLTLEQSLNHRRSVRRLSSSSLKLSDISQLLWAAQGITNAHGFRTAPSAGALYPLELFVVAGNIEGVPPGVYRYLPSNHSLIQTISGDKRDALCETALSQQAVKQAPATILISAVYQRTRKKYGSRGDRYVYIEVGHAAQNIFLQATALGLNTVTIGAFEDTKIKQLLNLKDEYPLYLMPIGN